MKSYEQTIAEKILDVMKRQLAGDARRLKKILVTCDEQDSLDAVKLNHAWHAVATDEKLKSSHIELHHNMSNAQCLLCHQEFELENNLTRCPHCHHEQFKIIHLPPTIETIEMV
jgi:Zn finger protein HypA/HybF involved in hydrogenase expression